MQYYMPNLTTLAGFNFKVTSNMQKSVQRAPPSPIDGKMLHMSSIYYDLQFPAHHYNKHEWS